MQNLARRGIIFFALAMIISGTIGLFVKWIDLAPIDIVFYRCLIASIALGAYVFAFERDKFSKILNKKLLIVLSGLILVFNWIFLFGAFKFTSISIAISIYYLAPIFVILYGILFLKEDNVKVKLITVIIAFIGAILVSGLNFDTQNSNLAGIVSAFFAAMLYAFLIIIAKKLKDISPAILAFIQTLIGAIVLIFFVSNQAFAIDFNTFKILTLLGVVHTALMYILFFKGVHLAPVSAVALLGFVDPLIAVLIDFTILHSKLSIYQWLGVFLIMAALAFKTLYELKKSL